MASIGKQVELDCWRSLTRTISIMKSQAILLIESTQIGTAPQTAAVPDRENVISCEFGVASAQPMKGTVSLTDFMRTVEADKDMASAVARARRDFHQDWEMQIHYVKFGWQLVCRSRNWRTPREPRKPISRGLRPEP